MCCFAPPVARFNRLVNRGLSRTDVIVTHDGQHVTLEINTNVGLANCHDIAFAFQANGFDYPALLRAYLASALHDRPQIATPDRNRPGQRGSPPGDVRTVDPTVEPHPSDQRVRLLAGSVQRGGHGGAANGPPAGGDQLSGLREPGTGMDLSGTRRPGNDISRATRSGIARRRDHDVHGSTGVPPQRWAEGSNSHILTATCAFTEWMRNRTGLLDGSDAQVGPVGGAAFLVGAEMGCGLVRWLLRAPSVFHRVGDG